MLISSVRGKLEHKIPAPTAKAYSVSGAARKVPVDTLDVQIRPGNKPSSKVPVQAESPSMGQKLLDWFSTLGQAKFQKDLKEINEAESWTKELKTAADFQAVTTDLKSRLAKGESLDSLQNIAYAVARQASVVATGMKHYDCQVAGALAMADGKIAEMMTGEGKTLTAVLPLYLNALTGKGAHLVTVNDRLAQRDRDEMAPIFQLLGLSVGCALESMTPEEKRAGYNCDVTYTTDRALGFDFLRDRTARRAEDKVLRPLHFALVDEVDQVLLDEARTPLIISGKGDSPSLDYRVFQDIVEELRPGIEYYVDREKGAAWLTESGTDFVENELYRQTIPKGDALKMADYYKRRAAIRAEGNAWKELRDHSQDKPGFLNRLKDKSWSKAKDRLTEEWESASAKSEALGSKYELYSEKHLHRTRPLFASLRANTLFEEGVDYLVQDQSVKIVDENKGRTSKGRRFNEGLHQALEAKSGVRIRPESKSIASITYPSFFAKYERLAGMSGTAASSEVEFQELYDLSVEQVPTNLQFKLNSKDPNKARRHNRIDKPDVVFASKREKFDAVAKEAIRAFENGQPVLIGTLSVEANQYVYSRLLEMGVPEGALRVLNAENVRDNKGLENRIIKDAGRSGMITVATNMAGRGVNIKPDLVNFKKLAIAVEQKLKTGSVTVDVQNLEEAKRLADWLQGNYPFSIGEGPAKPGEALIRVEPESKALGQSLSSEDFQTGGLYVIGTERAKSRRIDDQLIGRAARQGQAGKSQFFLSVEDDLFQYFGASTLDRVLKLVGKGGGTFTQELTKKLIDGVQARVGLADFATREDTTEYDKTLNKQRDAFYSLRDEILDPDFEARARLIEDSKTQIWKELEAKLERKRPQSASVREVLQSLNEGYGLQLSFEGQGKVKRSELKAAIEKQIANQVGEAAATFDKAQAPLDEPYRQTLLNIHDEAWSSHLDRMQTLKEGVQWVSFAEKDPELEYKLRGFEVFEETRSSIQKTSVSAVLPQLFLGARSLSA